VEPELRVRVALLKQLPRARRDRFIDVKLLNGSWEAFSRKVTLAQRLSDEQLEEVEDLDDVYTNVSPEFSSEPAECERDGMVKVAIDQSGKATPRRAKMCAFRLADRLNFEPKYRGRTLVIFAGMADLELLPRPVIDVPSAPVATQATAPVATSNTPQTIRDDGPIRAWLDQHSDEILACNGGRTVAVRVELDDAGAAKLELHGVAAGSPEASCFAAALAPPVFSPGPGTLIHLVKSAQ
jgi:hypothetical protein